MDGAVHTYKACLVAKGFTQTPRIDYEETFYHVADIRAIKIIIAIVAYLTDADDLKSQTGYVSVLNRGTVDWMNTKQSFFTTSSTEAEYIATSDTSKEAVWVKKFIYGLGVVPITKETIKTYYDNTGAITIANKSGITKGARYYRAKVHYF
nr:hypothetical protein [Tanacetum cinerariifolium]